MTTEDDATKKAERHVAEILERVADREALEAEANKERDAAERAEYVRLGIVQYDIHEDMSHQPRQKEAIEHVTRKLNALADDDETSGKLELDDGEPEDQNAADWIARSADPNF